MNKNKQDECEWTIEGLIGVQGYRIITDCGAKFFLKWSPDDIKCFNCKKKIKEV